MAKKDWMSIAFVEFEGNENAEHQLLCIQTFDEGNHGFWRLPGGRSKGTDKDPIDTAIFWLRYQTGIQVTRRQVSAMSSKQVVQKYGYPTRLCKVRINIDQFLNHGPLRDGCVISFIPAHRVLRDQYFLRAHAEILATSGLLERKARPEVNAD